MAEQSPTEASPPRWFLAVSITVLVTVGGGIITVLITVGGGFITALLGVVGWLAMSQFEQHQNTPGDMIRLRASVKGNTEEIEQLREVLEALPRVEGQIGIMNTQLVQISNQMGDGYPRTAANADQARISSRIDDVKKEVTRNGSDIQSLREENIGFGSRLRNLEAQISAKK